MYCWWWGSFQAWRWEHSTKPKLCLQIQFHNQCPAKSTTKTTHGNQSPDELMDRVMNDGRSPILRSVWGVVKDLNDSNDQLPSKIKSKWAKYDSCDRYDKRDKNTGKIHSEEANRTFQQFNLSCVSFGPFWRRILTPTKILNEYLLVHTKIFFWHIYLGMYYITYVPYRWSVVGR